MAVLEDDEWKCLTRKVYERARDDDARNPRPRKQPLEDVGLCDWREMTVEQIRGTHECPFHCDERFRPMLNHFGVRRDVSAELEKQFSLVSKRSDATSVHFHGVAANVTAEIERYERSLADGQLNSLGAACVQIELERMRQLLKRIETDPRATRGPVEE